MSGRSVYRLCLVTDRPLAGGRPLVDIVGAAVRGGVSMVQLREKSADTRAFLEEARALKALLAGTGVPLMINDRVDIALASGADGVHVGQSDMPLDMARTLMPAGAIIGLSITCLADLARPDAAAADYLGVGPVYLQTVKPDATPPLGVDGFAAIRRAT
ncbi:MAG: thiamine phosphate synthase, partial [Methylobacteriaceae bacterium]|nr:thiamine phosphate synthase [Methylobacteriaceae bacterium]